MTGRRFVSSTVSVIFSFLVLVCPVDSTHGAGRTTKTGAPKISGETAKGTTTKSRSSSKDRKDRPKKGTREAEEGADEDEKSDDLFLKESSEQQKFLPDIFRCPECGYEQDEAGSCPDHNEFELIKILSQGKNPLSPTELDGNEDLIVDIPLTGLTLRTAAPAVATATEGIAPAPAPKEQKRRR